jgi:hypothetical protein
LLLSPGWFVTEDLQQQMGPKPSVTNQPTLHNNTEKRRSEPRGGETLKYTSVKKNGPIPRKSLNAENYS